MELAISCSKLRVAKVLIFLVSVVRALGPVWEYARAPGDGVFLDALLRFPSRARPVGSYEAGGCVGDARIQGNYE